MWHNTLAVITTHFNPCGFKRPRENYDRFAIGLAALDIPLWTIELAYDGDPFTIPDKGRNRYVRAHRDDGLLWQKERLLNILIGQLEGAYDALAWVDADILFRNEHWAEDALEVLNRVPVVQCFEVANDVSASGARTRGRQSVGSWLAQPGAIVDYEHCHPGYAWAARTNWLARHKLYDGHPTGGADSMMVKAFVGGTSYSLGGFEALLSPGWAADWERWYTAVAGDSELGCVPGDIDHLQHGSVTNRGYVNRWTMLVEGAFDPRRDLTESRTGLRKWSDAAMCGKLEMVQAVAASFAARKEDDD